MMSRETPRVDFLIVGGYASASRRFLCLAKNSEPTVEGLAQKRGTRVLHLAGNKYQSPDRWFPAGLQGSSEFAWFEPTREAQYR